MMREFCSIFIQNTVNKDDLLTHVVSPDEIQHIKSESEWGVCKVCYVSVTVSKHGKMDLVFVQPGAKINSVCYCENVLE